MRSPTLLILFLALGCGREARFQVRESVGQLQVTHADPGATLEVVDGRNKVVASGVTDDLGSLMVRNLEPGKGYRVREASGDQSRELTVMSVASSEPAADFYSSQSLQPGFNYLRTRDGTTLSAWVTMPGPATRKYPTVVVYSGYSASRPGEPDPDTQSLCPQLPILCTPPQEGPALIAGMFGYATVSVNIRGTGCSGGAYDYFETMQVLDGYDAIQVVAGQPWVLHNQVGMVGISYPGISQLFVASQKPPGLAAIAPMAVIGNTASTLLPGGILNEGFALSWMRGVLKKAVPYGQGWEQSRVDAGDEQCQENQLLHGQFIDNVAQARNTLFYDPALHDRFNPTVFADQIEVPVFLAGGWQDEQTGPYFFTLFDRFTSSPAVRLNTINGVHVDSLAPALLAEWYAFLELFVAKRVPREPTVVRNLSPLLFQQVFSSMLPLPDTRWYAFSSYDEAVAAWKAEPKIRAIFESGAGDPANPGAPVGTFEARFDNYPPGQPLQFFFGPGGRLEATAPTVASSASMFRLDPGAGATGSLKPGGDPWANLPDYDWAQPAPGDAVVFESAPLAADLVLYGTASADLWLKAPVDDADLQLTLSEVRPDGKEMFVQTGVLRASYGALGPGASELWPAQTFEEKDWKALVPGEWTLVRVGTAGFGHVLRNGSRLRVTVDTPGGARTDWRYALETFPTEVRYGIAHEQAHPSSIALPVVSGITAPAALPPCPSLRGQPCRAHLAYTNTPLAP